MIPIIIKVGQNLSRRRFCEGVAVLSVNKNFHFIIHTLCTIPSPICQPNFKYLCLVTNKLTFDEFHKMIFMITKFERRKYDFKDLS